MSAAYPPSWYAASAAPPAEQPALDGRIADADVCILGAGYTGLSAALELARAGYRVVVLEAQRIGWGASGRNGGQAIVGYGCEQSTLEDLLGLDAARALFELSREGMDLLRARIAEHAIACDWRDGHAHVPIKPRQERALRAGIVEMAEKYGYPLQWWDRARPTSPASAVTCRIGCSFDSEPGGTQASVFWRSSRRARSPLSTRASSSGSAGRAMARAVASSRMSSSSATVSLCVSAFWMVGPGRTQSPRPMWMVP